jgi:DNA-binding transcriptional LysR family regulator
VDIAIRIGALQDSTLHARSLGSSKLRIVASPGYLAECGTPGSVEALRTHRLIGFTAPEHLNRWPLRDGARAWLKISPAVTASSGETIRRLALSDGGIACLADFMTLADVASGRLVPILEGALVDERQPVSAVFYQSAALAGRVQAFLDFIGARLRL